MGSGQLRIKFAEGDETPLLPTPPPLAAPPPIPQMVAASPQRSGSGQNIPADSSHYGFLVKSYKQQCPPVAGSAVTQPLLAKINS